MALALPTIPQSVIAVFLATLIVLSAVGSVTAHDPNPDLPSLFFSDDEDKESPSVFGGGLPEELPESGIGIGEYGDFFFDTTDPDDTFSIDGTNQTYTEWRENQVDTISQSSLRDSFFPEYDCIPHTGGWDPSDEDAQTSAECTSITRPALHDSRYIKDAHTTILGAKHGVYDNQERLPLNGRRSDQRNLNTLHIPGDGKLYLHTDFRADYDSIDRYSCSDPDWDYRTEERFYEVPKYDEDGNRVGTEIVTYTIKIKIDGDRTCESKSFQNPTAEHSITAGTGTFYDFEEIGTANTGSGSFVVEYSDLDELDPERILVESTYIVDLRTITRDQDWDPGSGWSTEDVTITDDEKTLEERSKPIFVSVTDAKPLTIRQRLIQVEGRNQAIVGVSIDRDVTGEHRMWSRLYLGDQQANYVRNVHGVYSARQYDHFVAAGRSGFVDVHNPPQVPALFLATQSSRPAVRTSDYMIGAQEVSISDVETSGGSPYAPHFRENVNLPSGNRSYVDSFQLRGAPREGITRAEDIHGNEINVETTTASGRVPDIEFTTLSDNNVQIVIRDPVTNERMGRHPVTVSGADQPRGATNRRGSLIVQRTSNTITATTPASDFSVPRSVYYLSATNSKSYLLNPALFEMLLDLGRGMALASPFVALYWVIQYARESELE